MTRYEELVSLYFDGEPDDVQLEELALLLRNDKNLAKDFREQLIIWEAWSQEVAPERSSESFIAALSTRLRAEEDANDFNKAATQRLNARRKIRFLRPILAAAALLAVALSFLWLRSERTTFIKELSEHKVSITGECICTRCTLKIKGGHKPAIRFANANGEIQILRIERSPEVMEHGASFCGGPTPAVIEGEMVERKGLTLLAVSSFTFK